MANDDNSIVVSIVLDDGSVKQGLLRVEQDTNSTFQRIGETAAGVFTGQALLNAFSTVKNAVEGLFDSAIRSASQAGQEIQQLNSTLAISGRFSEGASQQFIALADKIQATTTVSDDTALSIEKLASTYAKTNAQAIKLTQATIDFAAATGRDANEAATQLSATLSGQVGRLSRLFPELKRYTKSQLEAGAAVDYFASRFAGAAEAQTNTFGGSLIQLHNAFDDFLKSVGRIVTESPTVVTTIKFLSSEFLNLANTVTSTFGGQDYFANFAQGAITVARGFLAIISPIELVYNIAASLFQLFETGLKAINTIVSLIGDTVISTFNAVKTFAQGVGAILTGNIELADELNRKAAIDPFHFVNFDQTKASFDGLAKTATNAYNAVNGFGKLQLNDALTAALDRYAKALDNTSLKAQTFKNQTRGAAPILSDFSGQVDSVSESLANMALGFSDTAFNLVADASKLFQEQGAAAFKSFSNAITSGFAAIGKTLVTGGNVFKAFAGAVLSGLGAAAIQMGSFYILAGLARLYFSFGADATAYELIGVGTALSVLGGALSAFGDGVTGTSNPSTSVSTGGGSAISTDTSSVSNPDSNVTPAAASGPAVQVVIQGDVLDSQETGMRIVDLINQNFNSTGARVLAV